MPITPFYFKRPFHTGAEFPYALDSSTSNVRKSFKKFNIIGDLTWTAPEVYVMKRAFNSTGTLTPTTFTPVGNIQYNGTSYPLSFTDIGDYWIGTASITMSRSINPEFYLGLKCTGGVGTFDYPRSFVSSRLQNEGVLNDDGTGTDYSDGLMPYGAKATATVSSGIITGCSVTAGGWNYTATATVFAVEKINNVMYFKQIGTAAVSGGAVTTISVTAGDATGTTPSGLSGWVNPEIRISYGRSGFTTSSAGAGFTALYVAARPNGNVASVAAIGDSLVKYTAAQADLIPTIEGYNGQYEIGVNGRAPVVNAGIGSGTAQNFANFSTNYPILFRMLQLAHCNFGILAIGTNDIRNGRTAAAATTDMNTIVTQMRRMGMKVKTANVMPRTTSGSLVTPLDVNFDVGGSVFTLNTNINNGTVSNDLGVIDSRGTFHNPANTVEWGGAYVTDGTHVRDAGLGVASGAGYTAQFNNVVGT